MRSSRTLASVATATLAVLGLVLAGCSSGSDSSDTGGAGGTRTVTTEKGDVEVPTAPKRVVVLNYALAGYLYDLDVPVTATIPEDADGKGVFSEHWAADAKADGTTFLPWSTDGFDTEAILDAKPDLIIAGGIGFPLFQATKAYDQLSAIAPTVLVSGKLTDWQQQYSFLADDVFGKGEKYREAVAAYDRRVEEVKRSITVPPGESSFLSFAASGNPYVLIENRGLPKEFAKLGFRPAPLFATGEYTPYTAGGDSFELSTEQVGQVVTQDTVFVMGFNAPITDVKRLSTQPVYSSLPAFRKQQAYDLPYWAQRGDYDEAMALLGIVQKRFAK